MSVPITKRILPQGRAYGRPGYKLTGTRSVTVHNTANETAGADAEAHARYLEAGRAISWHFTVDADSIVQHLPLDEQGWHAGTDAGNTTSIGVEICEYPQTTAGRKLQAIAEDNAAWLIAKLMHERAVPISRVYTHKHWSGKYCPRDLLPRWSAFISLIKQHAGATPAGKVATVPAKNVIIQGFVRPAEAAKAVKALAALGIRAYIVNADTARLERKNPEGDPQ